MQVLLELFVQSSLIQKGPDARMQTVDKLYNNGKRCIRIDIYLIKYKQGL